MPLEDVIQLPECAAEIDLCSPIISNVSGAEFYYYLEKQFQGIQEPVTATFCFVQNSVP